MVACFMLEYKPSPHLKILTHQDSFSLRIDPYYSAPIFSSILTSHCVTEKHPLRRMLPKPPLTERVILIKPLNVWFPLNTPLGNMAKELVSCSSEQFFIFSLSFFFLLSESSSDDPVDLLKASPMSTKEPQISFIVPTGLLVKLGSSKSWFTLYKRFVVAGRIS